MRWVWLGLVPSFLWALKPMEDRYAIYRNNYHDLVGITQYNKQGVRTYDRWLTKRLNTRAYLGDVVSASRVFLEEYLSDFKIDPNSIEPVKVDQDERMEFVLFVQKHRGIPVYGAQVKLARNKLSKRFTFISSRYFPNLDVKETKPRITSSQAYQIAKQHVGITHVWKYNEPELVIYPRGKGVLAYRVVIPSKQPLGDWEIFVDAHTGKVFFVRDQNKYVNGSGMVWFPDPLTTAHRYYGDNSFWMDNNDQDNDSLNNQRISVTLTDISFDGTNYTLSGPWVVVNDGLDDPIHPNLSQTSSVFNFLRSEEGFEHVMVYFHIDSMQRYFQNRLGINNANAEPQDADPHGFSGADNSFYSPSLDIISFGEGGVDDAEDADVIVHEYGHAIQDDIVPGWGTSTEAGAMGEGFGDYLATVWSMRADTFRWRDVFTWDGHNPFWAGRDCDNNMHYPESLIGQVHNDGRIWCAANVQIIWSLKSTFNISLDSAIRIMDFLMVKHHFYLTASATMPEAAQAIIQADIDFNGGAHLSVILPIYDARGFINMSDYVPTIYHDPHPDTEDQTGPYNIYAVVVPSLPPLNSVVLKYWTSLNPTVQTVNMTNTSADTFFAQIPGLGQVGDVFYYIEATDQNGTATHPQGAPTNYHSFHVGPDTIPPAIVHSPIGPAFAQIRWPAVVSASVTDNIAVDSVYVEWIYNGTPQNNFTLTNTSGDTYEGTFPLPSVNIGDTIQYRIVAVDASSNANTSSHPETGYHTFYIIDALGVVLVINDDDGDRKTTKNGKSTIGKGKFATGENADSIASWLESFGYVVDRVDASLTDTSTWWSYDFIVWSSGEDISTVAQPSSSGGPAYADAMKTALANYYNNGGRIFFEGGELGYDAQYWDAAFANNVLFINAWSSDNPGDLILNDPSHPIATTPNALPSTIVRNDITSTWGDGDALTPETSAVVVFSVSNPSGNVGLITSPDGRVVFLSTSFLSIADWNIAKNLLENIAHFLMNTVSVSEAGSIPRFVLVNTSKGFSLRFATPVSGNVDVKIYAIDGRVVFSKDYHLNNSQVLDVKTDLPSGVYIYSISGKILNLKGKLVILR